MTILIFLGPTLSVEEARALCQEATFLAPVRQGELLSAVYRFRPDRIGIIDGVFLQDLAVWHKEILQAMECGVEVWGGGSMGALRAAELAPFGMIGVGRVYADFRAGTLTDDDEVAMSHGPAEFGYRKLSEPMVNIRATLQAALERELLTPLQAAQVRTLCKAMHFPQRSFAALSPALRQQGIGPAEIEEILRSLQVSYVDQKKQDAIALLQGISQAPEDISAQRWSGTAQSEALRLLHQCDRKVVRNGMEVSLASIARYAAVHQPGIDQDLANGVDEQLTNLLATLLGIASTPEQVQTEARAFWLRLGLATESEQEQWRVRNDVSTTELERIHTGQATRNRLRRWWLTNVGGRPGKAQVLLDSLRRADRYDTVADRAALQYQRNQETGLQESEAPLHEISVADLYRRHIERVGCRVSGRLVDWIADAGFASTDDFALELLRSEHAAMLPEAQREAGN